MLTIGYGHTGPDVYEGKIISENQAETLLREDLRYFERAVYEMIVVPLTQNEFDAIVSFTFNCGKGALQESTFRKRINAGEPKELCFREEFIRWTSGGMPGLIRRRDAEIELATRIA